MTMEQQPCEDVSPIKSGDLPASFSGPTKTPHYCSESWPLTSPARHNKSFGRDSAGADFAKATSSGTSKDITNAQA